MNEAERHWIGSMIFTTAAFLGAIVVSYYHYFPLFP